MSNVEQHALLDRGEEAPGNAAAQRGRSNTALGVTADGTVRSSGSQMRPRRTTNIEVRVVPVNAPPIFGATEASSGGVVAASAPAGGAPSAPVAASSTNGGGTYAAPSQSSLSQKTTPPGVSPVMGSSPKYRVVTQDYEPHARIEKDATALRNHWEGAPKGRVRIYDSDGPLLVPNVSLLHAKDESNESPQRNGSGADPGRDEGVPEAELDGEFYIPGIPHKILGPWRATSIAGNDITSSCLYTSGLIAQAAGIYAPAASMAVVVVLFLFRSIYTESCTALPMNGGTYNILLNTTGKVFAALAAVLTLLSYTATAVVSAASAGDYINFQWSFLSSEWVAIGILVAFAILTLMGVKDSANAALAIFTFHLTTMGAVVLGGLYFSFRDGWTTLYENYTSTSVYANPQGNVLGNLFQGFCSALLGVSGFESSSNYIEEQKPRVFAITLRNMWIAVSLVNPAITVVLMAVLPIEQLVLNSTFSLAFLAERSVGSWLRVVVVVDASLVLAGSVLTSFVGITGLMRRLSLDHVLPGFLLRTNSFRGTNHWIIFFFTLLTCSLRLLVSDMNTLAGVYSIAFLGVMSLFTVGNLVLKHKRGRLAREVVTPIWQCILALVLVQIGFFGNLVKGQNALYFGAYGVGFAIVVIATTRRVSIMRILHQLTRKRLPRVAAMLTSRIADAQDQPIVFFCRSHTIATFNKVIQYVITNEDARTIMFAHFFQDAEDPEEKNYMKYLEESCSILDKIYVKLSIHVVFVKGPFCPSTVAALSEELMVPRFFMFMSCPSDRFPHQLGHFGGVRVITH